MMISKPLISIKTKKMIESSRSNCRYILLVIISFTLNQSLKAQSETLPAGALIINMGSTTPTVNNALRPYGLIWDIIKNNKAQVRWVISQSKAKDGIDFTHNAIDYKGGTFIIPAEYRTAAVSEQRHHLRDA